MTAWFNKQSKVLRIILMIIPFVNWITELVLRWSDFAEKKDPLRLVIALIATFFFGTILGWVDAIWLAINDELLLENYQ